jgi:hypothetical protein
MKHLQIPSNKDQRLSKDIEKGDYSNKKKEKKMSAEDSLADKPKVGRASDKKPSNKRLDSEKHLSNKNMKHLKTFEQYSHDELTEEGLKDFARKAVVGGAMAVSLLGSPQQAHGQIANNKETVSQVKKTTETYDEVMKRMSAIADDTTKRGFGIGESPDLSFAESLAEQKAKSNILHKMGKSNANFQDVEEIEKHTYMTQQGNYQVLIVISAESVK